MGYQIPQQLEYKERIIFGLTFKQLGYLFVFVPLIMLILVKTNLNIYLKALLTINFSILSIGFIFLNFDYHIKTWFVWLKFRRIRGKKLEKFFPVKEIKDNLIITNKNKVAVLQINPVNFSIKSDGAKEAITIMFQKFLNSLDFPVQILMNTETINLDEYLNKISLGSISKKLKSLFEKYKKHLLETTSKNNVMNRNFYLIIPEKSDIEIQVQVCEGKLNDIGLKTERVLDVGLKKLILTSLKGDKSIRSIFDKEIENFPSYMKTGDYFHRTVFVHGYPREVETGFLDKIISSKGEFDISIHIQPYDVEVMLINLNKELQKQRADLYSANARGIINPSLDIKYKDTLDVLENLQKGKDKLFDVSIYINCKAKTKEELDILTKKIEAELNSLLIIPRQSFLRMVQGFQSCLPLAINGLKSKRNITTDALSAFFPFTSSFLQADKSGVWLGVNKNGIPIIKDIFGLSNPNGLCLASSGSGKSYMAKLLISRYLLNGVNVMVIDPQGEYKNIVERFDGQRIDLSRTSGTIINPLDLMGHEYSQKRLALMDLMPIMLGELTEPQKSFIDRALTEAYEENGINDDPLTWSNKPPILEDVLMVLQSMEKKAVTLEKTTIRSLINRLSMYVDGVFSFLNRHTNIDFNNKFVCFDIGNMPKQVKPVIMFLVLDFIYLKMKENINRKLLVIDEAWSLLGRAEEASYVFEIVKTCRKFNLALFLINQEVEGMLNSEAGKSVLANSSYTLLMRQKPAVMRDVQETFFLSNSERAFLLTASVGEGILLMDDEHSEIKMIASDEEHNLITTNPDEILKQNSITETKTAKKNVLNKQKNVKIKVEKEKRFYPDKDLKLDDIKYLISKGYKESKQKGILDKKEMRYLLKPRSNESIGHFFLTYDIYNYIMKFIDKVWLYETVKPDIVFEVNGKKYAIEVETGKVFTKDKKKLREKVKTLNKEFGENWFFVVTNRNFFPDYKNLGEVYTKISIANKILQICKK